MTRAPTTPRLITVATLVAMYRTNELPFHLKRALENGATKDELVELITHLAFYNGTSSRWYHDLLPAHPLISAPVATTNRGNIMDSNSRTSPRPGSTVQPDDPHRRLTLVRPDEDQSLPHIGLVGDTYTILLTGADTAGHYTLIDMYVPPGGGPPPHRHDFEESFTILEGEIEATFRGATSIVRAGETVNIPSNAPHQFHNVSGQSVRMLCICSPAGQDDFFKAVGVPVATRTTPPPALDAAAQSAFRAKAEALAPRYRTELLPRA